MEFFKYHGAGNDFIILDNRQNDKKLTTEQIALMCNRHLGIGADGLILLNLHPRADFSMVYYNSDGKVSTMCGNGGRCIVSFAHWLKLIKDYTLFIASDGEHEAWITADGMVSLKMKDINVIDIIDDGFFIDSGSPHFVKFVDNVSETDVFHLGRKIRYNENFKNGTNVNFVEIKNENKIKVRTYERGVENETLSCGTGAVASAVCCAEMNNWNNHDVEVETNGGMLEVKFIKKGNSQYDDIWLKGKATYVYKGNIDLHQI